MDITAAQSFARAWLNAWNAHDVEELVNHFAEDAIFTSPVAAQLLPETGGVLLGREAIGEYWALGLQRIPDLHFELNDLYVGVDTVVINYRNHTGALVCEVLRLADGLVTRGDGTYLTADAAGESGA